MPVSVATVLKPPSETAFRDLDYRIMKEAFSVHNQYGHLMDEACYRCALSNRCSEIDFESQEEVAIEITHGNFRKIYYIDLLVQRSVILELKTVEQLHPRHDSQLLNYLLLCELPYGKLINFGRPSVEARFVSTSLKRPDRSSFSIRTNAWQPQSGACAQIPDLLNDLLNDLGTHLDYRLYESAIHTLLSLEAQPVAIYDQNQIIGQKPMHLLSEKCALVLTGTGNHLANYRQNLKRITENSSLEQIQWVNLYRSQITLTTITS